MLLVLQDIDDLLKIVGLTAGVVTTYRPQLSRVDEGEVFKMLALTFKVM